MAVGKKVEDAKSACVSRARAILTCFFFAFCALANTPLFGRRGCGRYLTFFEKRLAPSGPGGGRMQLLQTAAVSPFAIVMFCNAGDVEVTRC